MQLFLVNFKILFHILNIADTCMLVPLDVLDMSFFKASIGCLFSCINCFVLYDSLNSLAVICELSSAVVF